MTVQWGPVPCIHLNGNLTSYLVKCGPEESEYVQPITVPGSGHDHSTTITGLTPSSVYTVKIAAVTGGEDVGPFYLIRVTTPGCVQ